MPVTYKKIASVTVGSGGAATINFSSIPSTYDDLKIVMCARSTRTGTDVDDYAYLTFNGSSSGYTDRTIRGDGSVATSQNDATTWIDRIVIPTDNTTANTFGNAEIYIPNYRSSNNKSVSIDTVMENNATQSFLFFIAGLWSNTSAITSITLDPIGTFDQYSTATLYGISKS